MSTKANGPDQLHNIESGESAKHNATALTSLTTHISQGSTKVKIKKTIERLEKKCNVKMTVLKQVLSECRTGGMVVRPFPYDHDELMCLFNIIHWRGASPKILSSWRGD